MAIFGKKKSDKDKPPTQKEPPSGASNGNSISSLSPTLDTSVKSQQSPYTREASGIPAPVGSLSHIPNKASISGPGGAGVGSGFASHPNQGAAPTSGIPAPSQPHPGSQAHPGAASGFRFGGPASRSDPAAASNIPLPGQPSMRSRKMSEQGGSIVPAAPPTGAPASNYSVSGIGSPSGPVSGLPPSSSGPESGMPLSSTNMSAPPADSTRPQQVVYPWSQKNLTMNPPKFLDESRQAPAGALSPFPFPRYGHAVNQVASSHGELYLFGGLVRESVKNDLYTVHVDKLIASNPNSPPGAPPSASIPPNQIYASATLVQTTGEIPPPRVGHATVLVSNVLILWGGDTKVRADDKQDEGLYLLNLSTREWTRVKAGDGPGSCPVGRYGHSVAIIGSRFFVFGGQVDGTFMNDLWCFDLNSLKGTPSWQCLQPSGDIPPKRTGHASVTYKDKIYVFGGTDGQYHYNDTWCYDITLNSWKELSCIGYIPVPREGHAACLVDDVMYIFGGRGVDGKDLGDLASFKVSNQRWYMFANMGPSPSGRSGHAMSTFQNKVIVLGGESFTGAKPDDPSSIHVLDTAKIKYPPDNASQQKNSSAQMRNSSLPSGGQPASGMAGPGPGPPSALGQSGQQRNVMAPVAEHDERQQTMSPSRPAPRPLNGTMPNSPDRGGDSVLVKQQQQQQLRQTQPPSQSQAQPHPQPLSQQHQQFPPIQTQMQQANPQDPSGGSQFAPSSGHVTTNSDVLGRNGSSLPQSTQPMLLATTATQNQHQTSQQPPASGVQGSGPVPYMGPRSQRSLENMRAGGALSPTGINSMRSINGVVSKMDSPAVAPQDGFHYGRTTSPSVVNGYMSPQSVPAELDSMRKREGWYKAALALAVKKGFVEPKQLQMADGSFADAQSISSDRLSLEDIDTGAEGSDKDRILRMLVSLKAQLASAKATIAQQAQGEGDRLGESERARSAALQEAAYYRAKLSAIESGNADEVSRLDRERANKLERSLSDALRESDQLERQVSSLREQAKLEQQLRTSAEERLSETAKRAMAAEAAQMKAYDELSALQKRSHATESALREHTEQVATLSSMASRHKADHDHVREQLDAANSNVAAHLTALAQLQAAHASVTSRASGYERLHEEQRGMLQQQQAMINDLKAQLESKSGEAFTHSSRVAELETLLSQHRQEAEAHRMVATDGLAALLAQREHADKRDVGDTSMSPHIENKMQALEDEAESLRQLHSEARQIADSNAQLLQEMREKHMAMEKQHSTDRSELNGMRSQLMTALQEVARLKDVMSGKDLELRDRNRNIEAAQVKASLLKQFMAERGVSVPDDEELSVKSGYADRRIRELEEEIDLRARELQEAEHRLQDSESRVDELTRELEHHVSLNASRGSAEVNSSSEAEKRAEAAERELVETKASYQERMTHLENDYQTAVQFVKGTEKMLRRMKDEVTRYKTQNASLQSEIVELRSGYGGDDAARSEEAARDIEALRSHLADVTQQSEEIAAVNHELERKLALLSEQQRDSSERIRDADSNASGSAKVNELELEIRRLESSLDDRQKQVQKTLELNNQLSSELSASKAGGSVAADGEATSVLSMSKSLSSAQTSNEQLKRENAKLTQRLQELDDKFQLLLGRMESTHEPGDERARDSMAYGSITSELDKWERDRTLDEADAYGLTAQPGSSAEAYAANH